MAAKKYFKKLVHNAIFANDVKASLEFYQKLGFEVIFDMRTSPDAEPWNYYLRIVHGQYLEIMTIEGAAPSPHPSPVHVASHEDRSLWHLALETDNLRETIESLTKDGIPVWKDPEKTLQILDYDRDIYHSDCGCDTAWLIDPDGNTIEILQQVRHPTLHEQFDPE